MVKVLAGREVPQAGVGTLVDVVVNVALQPLVGELQDGVELNAALELVAVSALQPLDERVLLGCAGVILEQGDAEGEAGVLEDVLELRALFDPNRANG